MTKADSCCESPKQMLRGFSLSQEVYEITPRMQSTSQFIFHPHWLNPSFWVGIIPDKLQMVRIIPAEEMSQSQQRPVAGKASIGSSEHLLKNPEIPGDGECCILRHLITSTLTHLTTSSMIFHPWNDHEIIAWVSHSYPIRWYKVPWHHPLGFNLEAQGLSNAWVFKLSAGDFQEEPRKLKTSEDVINSDEHEHGES